MILLLQDIGGFWEIYNFNFRKLKEVDNWKSIDVAAAHIQVHLMRSYVSSLYPFLTHRQIITLPSIPGLLYFQNFSNDEMWWNMLHVILP